PSARFPFFVSTIVPACNEAGNIEQFCRLFADMLQSAPFDGELVYIDDGSTDDTLDKIKAAAAAYPFVRYVSHQHRRGVTDALRSGFSAARGDVFVFYPADLQFLPEDIPALVAPIADGADLVAGWKQGEYQKRFVSTVYNWLSRKIFNLKVHDLNACKAFRRGVVEQIFMRKDWHRYLVVLAANEGFRVEEVKVRLYPRAWGRSKYQSIWRVPVGVLDMLAVKFQLTFLRKPLMFFGFTGLGFFLLGFLVGLWAVYLKYWRGETQLPLLYLVLLLVGLGIALFAMGFITEGQAAIKEELASMRREVESRLRQLSRDRDHG
ncbi:MAG TPA: glycosyltransferase family 2 protein, partial [candidate division Zixibacteria bacterium]|nr:glycosyltransferase family 2 protein [candidate division Zixibacteria bacterium]